MDEDYYDRQVAGLNRDCKHGEWIMKGSFIFLVPVILTLWAGDSWVLAAILILLMAVTWWIGVRKRNKARESLTELGELHK